MRDDRIVRVFIVNDDDLVRRCLSMLIGRQFDFQVVGEAATFADATTRARELRPDVVLLDLYLPDGSGIVACREIRSQTPSTRVIMLASYSNDEAIIGSVLAGASGYLLKEIRAQETVNAIRRVGRGQLLLDPAVTQRAMERLGQTIQKDDLCQLTRMEQEVLGLVIGGNTNREIAATMRLSDTTVRDQINSILNKVETICRAQVAAYVVRWQIQRVFQYRRRESTSNTLETITGWEYNYLPPSLL